MGSTYNEVTPMALGKSKGKKRSRNKHNVNTTGDTNSYIPAAPPDSPPPPIQPPAYRDISTFGHTSTFGTSQSVPQQLSSTPQISGGTSHSANFMESLPQFSSLINPLNPNSHRGLPKPTSSGVVQNPQPGNSMALYEHMASYLGSPSAMSHITPDILRRDTGSQGNAAHMPLQQSLLMKSNKKKRKTNNNAKQIKTLGESNPDNAIEEQEKRKRRAEKFKVSTGSSSSLKLGDEENFANLNAISTKSHNFDTNKRIVGLCQNLEKSYLRLTSEPNPDLVRPLSVLKKTYVLLMNKHKKKKASYQYLCDQFKSMRQDLRVQMIENQFTVKVYESHARIALENGDIGEFNQCQSRLIVLFELPNIKASFLEEFTSYRILYYMLTGDNGYINMLRLKLMTKNQAVFSNHMVKVAFDLAHASLMGDYHNYMKIYASLEPLGKKLVDAFVEKENLRSLVTICKSYNQINLDFLIKELKFEGKESIIAWFQEKSLDKFIVTKNQGEDNEYQILDTKACRHIIVRQYSGSKKIDIKGQQ